MKRTLALSTALAAALALAACGERAEPVEDGPIENASAQSGVGSNAASNAVQDAASGVVGTTSAATLGRTTGGFVTNAAIADMYEIAAGNLAGEKGQNAQVKEYGKMLVADHTRTSGEMKTAAQGVADVTMPTAMDERRQGMVDNLRQAPAGEFDRVFLAQQIAAHEENVLLHETYAENGDNAALKALAAKNLPGLRQHLERARQLEGSMGGGQSGGQAGAQGGQTSAQ
jgi:putative membrane protein